MAIDIPAQEIRKGFILFFIGVILAFFIVINNAYAETSSSPILAVTLSGAGGSNGPGATGGIGATVSGTGTVLPDLFTGTMSHNIPIEVPAGRKGMDPGIALTYRSNNGNGRVGVGWDLDVGAIERGAAFGIDYNDNDENGKAFILRMSGNAIDLIYDSTNSMYRAKIEGGFVRVKMCYQPDNDTKDLREQRAGRAWAGAFCKLIYPFGTACLKNGII